MSRAMRKRSDLIYTDTICYMEIPNDYTEETDFSKYVFTVAAKQ